MAGPPFFVYRQSLLCLPFLPVTSHLPSVVGW
jgi:hypothetical protein